MSRRIVEFAIYRNDPDAYDYDEICGGDVDFTEGKYWRSIHKIVQECEQGLHQDISLIERVVRELDYYDTREETELYRHPRFKHDRDCAPKKEVI